MQNEKVPLNIPQTYFLPNGGFSWFFMVILIPWDGIRKKDHQLNKQIQA